jgi:hypothetical protein
MQALILCVEKMKRSLVDKKGRLKNSRDDQVDYIDKYSS